jgi:hypothetical protein
MRIKSDLVIQVVRLKCLRKLASEARQRIWEIDAKFLFVVNEKELRKPVKAEPTTSPLSASSSQRKPTSKLGASPSKVRVTTPKFSQHTVQIEKGVKRTIDHNDYLDKNTIHKQLKSDGDDLDLIFSSGLKHNKFIHDLSNLVDDEE